MNHVFETVGVLQEVSVTDFVVIRAINGLNEGDLLGGKRVAEKRQCLLELLSGDFEVLVTVPVLEEALGVEPLFTDDFGETVKNALHTRLIELRGRGTAVNG